MIVNLISNFHSAPEAVGGNDDELVTVLEQHLGHVRVNYDGVRGEVHCVRKFLVPLVVPAINKRHLSLEHFNEGVQLRDYS